MIILYYGLKDEQIVSSNVHITELLNNLTRLGHTVLYANGKVYTIMGSADIEAGSRVSNPRVHSGNVKQFILKTKFRGEAIILYNFLREIHLFLLSFRTILNEKPDVIYRRHMLYNSEYLLSTIFKIPYVKEVNGIAVDEMRDKNSGDSLTLKIVGLLEKRNITKADTYIVVTSALKSTLNHYYNISFDKIFVIQNGANVELFKPRDPVSVKRELNLDTSVSFICFVGGLSVWHGIDDFISSMPQVLKEYPNAKALIVGEGAIRGDLERQSQQLGLSEKIIFTGSIPHYKVPDYINASEICVSPLVMSKRNQKTGSSPLKLYEYLACGKPVISSRLNGQEFLEENECGLLVNTYDDIEFAEAILQLLRNPVLRQKMGERGRLYILKNRTWEIVAREVTTVFKITINGYRKR